MAKRKAIVVPKPPKHKCHHQGCKRPTSIMMRNRKTGKQDRYCGPHWKSDVEDKNPEVYRNGPLPKAPKSASPKKKVVRKRVKK